MLVALGEKGVKTLDDLADLASDELREIVGESAMDNDTANAIIMKAREHWFAGRGRRGRAKRPRPRTENDRSLALAARHDPTRAYGPAVAGPLRTCIVTGEEGAPERMIRFVVGPEGDVVPDLARRLPGRGMWVRAERAAVEQAVAKKPVRQGGARGGEGRGRSAGAGRAAAARAGARAISAGRAGPAGRWRAS